MSEPTPIPVQPPSPTDRLLGRVIVLVGVTGLVAVLGVIGLAVVDKAVPDILNAVIGGALTGLTGLLAARRT